LSNPLNSSAPDGVNAMECLMEEATMIGWLLGREKSNVALGNFDK